MRGKWRLLSDGPASAAWNMAVDEAIMTMVGRKESPPTLRIYGWDPPALSLGYFQRAAEVDLTACRSRGVDVVRRPTGGRAILHDQEVTYSLSLPEDLPWLPRGVTEAYRLIAGGLVRGLKILGVPVEMAPAGRRGAGKTAACFDAPCSYEIVARGRAGRQRRAKEEGRAPRLIPLKLRRKSCCPASFCGPRGEESR